METSSHEQNSTKEIQPKLPYNPPLLTSLWEDPVILQHSCMVGTDGGPMTTSGPWHRQNVLRLRLVFLPVT